MTAQHIQDAVDALAKVGGGVVYLPARAADVVKTVRLPANVRLESSGSLKTCIAVRPARPSP